MLDIDQLPVPVLDILILKTANKLLKYRKREPNMEHFHY